MELSIKYDPSKVEDKWYAWWLENRFFHSEPDGREPYTIVIPPPNVTGILHMGHVLNNTLNDVLIRKARMDGKNACWVPGTDHASIATENKVVAKLKGMGISKEDISREEFLRHAWAWKEEHGNKILLQLRKLGASCDWDRTRFTMDPDLSKAVTETFVYFYKKGLIYRGVRMVNWDPEGHTAVSDEEVVYKDTKRHLYYVRYFVSDGEGHPTDKYLTVATTRPETIMADAAVSVNPNDERYLWLRGKKVLVPLVGREIPVIEDDYVSIDFGTGCLKVTPAHDPHDYEIGLRHNLPIISVIDDRGKLTEEAVVLVGEDRFQAQKDVVGLLEAAGNLDHIEDYSSPVGYSERTNAAIEPMLSTQWFLKMGELSKNALEAVESGNVKLIPDKYRNTYRHWMENVRDWCISRQLWWGQQIPAWYLPDGRFVVESDAEKALEAARELDPAIKAEDLRQDPDVLDTWFSSWLWPISVFDPEKPGHPERESNPDLAYYYPTNDLVTGPDILFFWVARMIMAGDVFMSDVPFRNVYLTGIVRDKLGRKMSKQLGNSPDPLDLVAKYGADAVRIGMLLCSSAGNDIFYDESMVEQGRNFCGKIWNSWRLVSGWSVDEGAPQSEACRSAVKWFDNLLSRTIAEVEDNYSKFRISDALMAIYRLFWDSYCSWYLEIVKPVWGESIDRATLDATVTFFDKLLRLIHPVMPFITEELWQAMAPRKEGETIMFQPTPKAGEIDRKFLAGFDITQGAVIGVRGIRAQKQIPPKQTLGLHLEGKTVPELNPVLEKLANVELLEKVPEGPASSFIVGTVQCSVPLSGLVDSSEELGRLEAELARQKSFLEGVRRKLGNAGFVAHAPEAVIAGERKKEADALSRIEALEKTIASLSK
ncbi:MAG: valine--tRNA ligase [Bacteroidales bacterium]|nr:valine--tRNA ligase [Bacteroidales bacterium]